ncbi:MAG TPA: leucyl/phenylalanyl-tRNA--protein transferase [Gammaproteobacteria bacterium]|nr:leucyl/phenylalanyl-tRNA--protein transferase [Gammaproteobacteria bacterium]
MSTPRWLTNLDAVERFPNPNSALTEPNGLLAAGGDLEPERLLGAYVRGIFPWYEQGQPILWWSPDPRAVLWPAELHVSRSLKRSLIKGGFELRVDSAFDGVLAACAAPRRYTDATWITADMAHAYGRLHNMGWAHSFETWRGGELVGGLYGVAIGRVFFGESMFARVTDASKVALVRMVQFLEQRGFALIDCQVASQHIATLGARAIPRREFLRLLDLYCKPPGTPQSWRTADP